jgi:hypothetical protein
MPNTPKKLLCGLLGRNAILVPCISRRQRGTGLSTSPKAPDNDSVRLAMELAWRDHHHAREQTWKAIQIEAVLGAGLVTVAAQFKNSPYAIGAAAILVFFAAIFGIAISLHHRELERRKFAHILNCEEYLGLHRDDLIPVKKGLKIPTETGVSEVGLPGEFSIWAVFNPLQRMNTAIFILRMHIAIAGFALIFLIYVFWPWLSVFWRWL